MVDITHKQSTLRQAIAEATVAVSSEETIRAIQEDRVPKGNVFAMAKAAGLLGVKKTPELLPDCHPLPIEYTDIQYEIEGLEIRIRMEVKTIYKTGVEVEAMHGASVVALTMYDMLKPLDKGVEIRNIRLLSKKGGKSDFKDNYRKELRAVVVVCSDTISKGKKEDRAGKAIMAKLEALDVAVDDYLIIPDEPEEIRALVVDHAEKGTDLVIFTGGTGMAPRDVTPDTIIPLLEREIPGIGETARAYGQLRTPFSMLSRSVGGIRKRSVILSLPGSTKGAAESMDALFPGLLHVFRVLRGARHD